MLLPYRFAGNSSGNEADIAVRELGHYLTLRAVVDAIGNSRDPRGFTPHAAVSMLHELLDDSTNAANPCEDGYLLGAVVELLCSASPSTTPRNSTKPDSSVHAHTARRDTDDPFIDERRVAGAVAGAVARDDGSVAIAIATHVRSSIAQVQRMLALDALRPTNGRVLTVCCLRGLVKLELKWRLVPSWDLYMRHESDEDAPAAVRLEAARCLFALAIEQGGPQHETVPDATRRLSGAPQPGEPVLALALRLDEARWHAPLERLQLWRQLLGLLEEAEKVETEEAAKAKAVAHEDRDVNHDPAQTSSPKGSLARQRALMATPPQGGQDDVKTACCQLLWRLMTSGRVGVNSALCPPADVRLRLVLCRLWRLLFADNPPGCLGLTDPVRISHREILPRYIPPYRARQKNELAARLAREAEEKAAAKSALRLLSLIHI